LGDFSPQTHLVTLEMGSSGSGRWTLSRK
jgi:hypothetical protein